MIVMLSHNGANVPESDTVYVSLSSPDGATWAKFFMYMVWKHDSL